MRCEKKIFSLGDACKNEFKNVAEDTLAAQIVEKTRGTPKMKPI